MSFHHRLLVLVLGGLAPALGAAPPAAHFVNLAVYRPAENRVYAFADLTAKTLTLNGVYGAPGDVPLVGDFDGNGVHDLAVYRNGAWLIDANHDYVADVTIAFGGAAGDVPLAGDFDGEGRADAVIYRAGTWFIRSSRTGMVSQRTLGGAQNQLPIVADFDGDAVPDIAVYRNGTWLIQTTPGVGPNLIEHFGGAVGDRPCAVDWDHDGRADLCVYRRGIWFFKAVGSQGILDSYAFGGADDIPLPGGVFDYGGAIYVNAAASGLQDGTAAHPFATLVQAFDAAIDGSVIRVAGGSYVDNTFVFWGPSHQYAPGKFGKNNIKLLGVSRRAVSWSAPSNDTVQVYGSTGNVLEGFSIQAPNKRAIVLAGGPGSFLPDDPGSTLSIAFNDISETASYGILVTGTSNADIRHNRITRSRSKSGIGLQGGAPVATIAYNELTHHGYTLASGVDGNGIEAQSSATVVAIGNFVHDNNRFGIIGVSNAHLTLSGNSITANQLNGVILCGAGANDTSTAQIVGNTIANNGISTQNGIGYNGVEFYLTCVGSHTVSGNTFSNNSLNGVFIGAGTLVATGNTFSNNKNGLTMYVDNNSSTNVQVSAYGNTFTSNVQDGVYAERAAGTTRIIAVTVGGAQVGQANSFSGHGFHAIGCKNVTSQMTCPTGGNTFNANVDDIEFTCPASCVK